MHTDRTGLALPANQRGVRHIGALVPLVLARYADIARQRSGRGLTNHERRQHNLEEAE